MCLVDFALVLTHPSSHRIPLADYLTMTTNGINAFLGLPVATQSLLSWSLLAFLVYFVSGFWTFKISLAIFLLLFRPLSSSQLAIMAKKRTPRQRDAHGQLFSADPLVAALQVSPQIVSAACGRM